MDQALVKRALVETRARAQDLVKRGLVTVDGIAVTKPAELVDGRQRLAVAAGATDHVSRGAEKLIAALDRFDFDASGRVAIDIGASTGGFTDVLLTRGALRVYAVDVGRGQLHARLRTDPRVVMHEATDARDLTAVLVPDPITAIVADVSFISLTKALSAAMALASSGCFLAALVKPQFEAGRAAIGKGGIVRDPAAHSRVVAEISAWVGAQAGWRVVGECASPIAGGDGNREFLIGAVRA